MKFIIALLALSPNFFVEQAQKEFAPIAVGYLLSESSLPHISLAHFDLNDVDKLPEIWNALKDGLPLFAAPRFLGIEANKRTDVLWSICLSVARDLPLIQLHLHTLSVLKKFNLQCLIGAENLYSPHLTLAKIKIKELKEINFNDLLLENIPFTLALGQRDDNNQFIKIIYQLI